MLFDPEPKRSKKDFYNMEKELGEFIEALERDKLIVVTGLRRYGKTSLILTGLSEAKLDYVFLDCRLLPDKMISVADILGLLKRELEKKSFTTKLLSKIESIELGSLRFRFRKSYELLIDLLSELEDNVIVVDEAQELRRSTYRFDKILAYLYDHTRTRIVVSGSQVGLLYRFLRIDNPESPLYGRPYREIKLGTLSREKARDFLEKGFREQSIEPPEEVIEEALEAFNGVIGWLTFFGYHYVRTRRTVREVLDYAAKLAAKEAQKILNIHSSAQPRYREVLRVVALLGEARWSEIYRSVTARLGRIPRNRFNSILRDLVAEGLLVKRENYYEIPDPVLKYAVRKNLL